MKEKKCGCINRLDKLRLDVEQGAKVSFICFVFRGEGLDLDVDPIVHEVTANNLYIAAGEAQSIALARRLAEERES